MTLANAIQEALEVAGTQVGSGLTAAELLNSFEGPGCIQDPSEFTSKADCITMWCSRFAGRNYIREEHTKDGVLLYGLVRLEGGRQICHYSKKAGEWLLANGEKFEPSSIGW